MNVFPERDATKPAEAQGLFDKFEVRRVDGSDAPGGKHQSCAYFVIDLDHDEHRKPAMMAYAAACFHTHPELSAEIAARFGMLVVAPFGYFVVESDEMPYPGAGFVKKPAQGVAYKEIIPLYAGDMDYEEVLADHRALVRQLDVALNGEAGAAPQASLSDIVKQVETEGIKARRA